MRVAIYCRISKDREGAGLGVKTQEKDCRDLAASLGGTIVAVHTDNDLSAYSGKPRPGYAALLASIAAGEVDAVLTWHTDRLHRSPAELEDYITACETNGVRTVTVKAGTLDLSSPSGLVMARTLGAFARYEVDHARERMQRAKRRVAESGGWKGGRRPFGYESDGVTVRESEAEPIRQAADAILAGESLRSIARRWHADGVLTPFGNPWDPANVRRVLLRPRYAGLMEHQGEVIGDAAWPAIIDREKWEAIGRLLADPARRKSPASNAVAYLGSNLYRCAGCGGTVRSARSRQGLPQYRCRTDADLGTKKPGEHVSRKAEEVDRFVSEVVVERLRRADLTEMLREHVGEVDVAGLESRAIELEERKGQLAAMFGEGAIDAAQLTAGSKTIAAELDRVREQITAAYSGSVLEGIASAPDPGAAWLDATLERQRLVLDALLTVTLRPSPRGRPPGWTPGSSYFRPESVQIDWKGQP